jgi:hypothetical protein
VNPTFLKPRVAAANEPLLVAPDAVVTCPKCQHEFSLADGFASRSFEQLRQAGVGRLEQLRRSIHDEESQRTNAQLAALKQSIAESERERWKLKETEYQKKLEDMMKRLDDAQRSAAQGSQQLQGEVLELVLEEQLRAAFPLHRIEEVKKGTRGGDVIQRVLTRGGQQAGTILWEAKRAQSWSRDWSAKLKEDQRALGAEVGVIVSLVMPKECAAGAPFDLHEDVWVTSPGAAIALAKVLCIALLDVHKQRRLSTNRGEKMAAVYDYVTSAQFGQKVRAIAETLKRLRDELESERAQTMQRWSRREKQIQQAVVELTGLGGELQGIAQQDLPQLEIEPPEPGNPTATANPSEP